MGNFVVTLVGNVVTIKLFGEGRIEVTDILEAQGIVYMDMTHTAKGKRRPSIKAVCSLGDDVEVGITQLLTIFNKPFRLMDTPTFTYSLDDDSGIQVVVKVEEGAAGDYLLTISDELSSNARPETALLTLNGWNDYAQTLDAGATEASRALLAEKFEITDLDTSIGAIISKTPNPEAVLRHIAVLYP